jgi:hypothetical protein
MNLARARSLSLVVALLSCSTDTLVVATLDASGGEGGEPGVPNAGGKGGDEPGSGGVGDERGGSETAGGGTGGSSAAGGGSGSGGTAGGSGLGGTGSVTEIEGEFTTNVCACIGSASFACGADGVTYDPSCTSGCDQIVIACLHACPCTDDTANGGAPNSTEWVDERCFDSSLCPSGHLCFTSDGTGSASTCEP